MSMQFKFPPENETYDTCTAVGMAMIIVMLAVPLTMLELRFRTVCALSFASSTHNMTINSSILDCSVPYDQCRCSVSLHRSSGLTKECITDVEAIAGHIVPLVVYAAVLYLFYNLVSFTGEYRHIFTDIFWIIALVIFVILAIAAHGSSCFHFYTILILSITSVLLATVIFYLFCRVRDQYLLRTGHNTNSDQRLTTDNYKHNITITFTFF